MTGTARIGCSGYDYDDWRGVVYPADLPKRKWFGHYAERFPTVELNATFYGLPQAGTVDGWRERAPEGFVYAVKLNQYGTHRKKLKDPAPWVERFCAVVERLGPTLGPVLVQLPPRWRRNVERLDGFLRAAPRAHRWAVEVRDPSWLHDEVYDVLSDHGAALVHHDLLPDHPDVVTTDWLYLRFHGPDAGAAPYSGSYSPQKLSAVADRIAAHLAAGRDVYCYFNNDIGGAAPDDAADLTRYVANR